MKVSRGVMAGITVAVSLDLPQVGFVFPEGKGKDSAD